MKRKLIITALGIASLGINSVLVESVHSQVTVQSYGCYLRSNGKFVGHVTVIDGNSPIVACNEKIKECFSDESGCIAYKELGSKS